MWPARFSVSLSLSHSENKQKNSRCIIFIFCKPITIVLILINHLIVYGDVKLATGVHILCFHTMGNFLCIYKYVQSFSWVESFTSLIYFQITHSLRFAYIQLKSLEMKREIRTLFKPTFFNPNVRGTLGVTWK